MADDRFEAAAREVLRILGDQYPDGSWFGHDTVIGTDAEVVGEAAAILRQYFGVTMDTARYDPLAALKGSVCNTAGVTHGD
jgi:hypothetical protein